MRYYAAKMQDRKDEAFYRAYTADTLCVVARMCGASGGKRYTEILYPAPVDDRPPEEIALERAANMGLKVVS